MEIQELRKILVHHIAEDNESHSRLVDALTNYVSSTPGDHDDLVSIFTDHIQDVETSHRLLLDLVDRDIHHE